MRCVLILVLICSFRLNIFEVVATEEVNHSTDLKLDKILERLDSLEAKQEELKRIVVEKNCINFKGNEEKQNEEVKVNFKRESVKADSFFPSKDLFRVNKLANNINSIPSSSSPDSLDSFENENPIFNPGSNNVEQEKLLIRSLGQQYESKFSNSFENLNAILREQLVGFRLTLNKLMNRLIDHSYQYNIISNQLSLIKDECAFAASFSSSLNSSMLISGSKVDKRDEEVSFQPLMNTFRTSDISILVRLLSREISQALMSNETVEWMKRWQQVNNHVDELTSTDRCVSGLKDNQAELRKDRELIWRRLEEINSVTKQSALFLTRLANNGLSSNGEPTQTLVLTYNNSNVGETTTPAPNSTNNIAGSRWFHGSKVPGKSMTSLEASHTNEASTLFNNSSVQVKRCQSKTNLVTPFSCQQLRLAGANCSGQYYVFVRGSIRHVFCDMNMDSEDDGGGWTVILRRIDKSLANNNKGTNVEEFARPGNHLLEKFKASQVDFSLSWLNYKNGFGYLDEWGEFFIGLDLLHQLVSANQLPVSTNSAQQQQQQISWSNHSELQLDLETSEGNELHLKFEQFFIENEESQYRIHLNNCNSSKQLCEPLQRSNGLNFYTFNNDTDRLDNGAGAGAGDASVETIGKHCNWGGWWRSPRRGCETSADFSLTKPIGDHNSAPNEPKRSQHLHWPNWAHSHEPLRRVVMKIRRRRLNR